MPCEVPYLEKIGDCAFLYCERADTTKDYIKFGNTSQIVTYKKSNYLQQYNINTFAGVTKIYVPISLKSAYEADTDWAQMITLGITFIGY